MPFDSSTPYGTEDAYTIDDVFALADEMDAAEGIQRNPAPASAMGLPAAQGSDTAKLQAYVNHYNQQNPDTPIPIDDIPDRSGFLGGVSELVHGTWHAIVDQFPEDMARIWQGADIKVDDDSYIQSVIDEQEKDRASRVLSKQVILGDKLNEALYQGPASIATSATVGTAGALGGAALGTAVAPGPGTAVGAMAGAGATTGPAFYRLAKNQFLDEMLDVAKQSNANLSESEWEAIKADIEDEATKYGLWEAGPEALSQAFTAGLLKGVGGKIFGNIPGVSKVTDAISKRALARAGAKIGAEVAEEEATEYATYEGQEGIRKGMGLRKTDPSLQEFIDTQAGPVAVGAVMQMGVHKVGSKTYDLLKGGVSDSVDTEGNPDLEASLNEDFEESEEVPQNPEQTDDYSEEAVNKRYAENIQQAREENAEPFATVDLLGMPEPTVTPNMGRAQHGLPAARALGLPAGDNAISQQSGQTIYDVIPNGDGSFSVAMPQGRAPLELPQAENTYPPIEMDSPRNTEAIAAYGREPNFDMVYTPDFEMVDSADRIDLPVPYTPQSENLPAEVQLDKPEAVAVEQEQSEKLTLTLSASGQPFKAKGAKAAATNRSRRTGKPFEAVEYEPGKWGLREVPAATVKDSLQVEDSVDSKKEHTESAPYSRESHADFIDKLNSGDMNSETFKQNFKKVQKDKDSIIADLRKLTKKKLLPMTGMRYTMSDKKDTLVSAAYESMLNSFSLDKPISYMMTADGLGKVRALEDIVDFVTDEDLKAHAEDHSKRRAEQDEYIKGKQKALENPETYEDYDFFVQVKGADSLTTEQRMRWDELQAEKSGERKEVQKEQAAKVQAVQSEGITLEYKGQTVHSKHGHDLFVVGLADRVDKPAFSELRSKAKQLGGYYSKFRGHGAIPGFQFKTKETADKFMGLQDGDVSKADLIEEKEGQSQNKAVNKLREMASSLRESADESLGQDRRTNTARQARMAASAEAGAETNKRFARTMENIADAIESGESKMLSGIKAKTHIELLESRARQAKWEYDRSKGVRYEVSKESPATPEHMSAAKLPSFTFDRGVILDMAKDVETIRGGKRLALMLRTRAKRAKRVQGHHEPVYNFRLYDEKLIRDLVTKFNQSGDKYKGWQVRDKVADLDRLARMGITTDAELRVALREYLTYRGKKVKADPVKEAERALVGRKIDGYFPTPKPIVERMLDEADVEPGMDVLEPSAGKGNIADLIKEDEPEANLETIEPVQDLRNILEAKEHKLVGRDFLGHDGEYDRIIMNPPFEKRLDVEHVRNAYKLLKPGGRVVAIMSEGPFFGKDKAASEFRDWLDTVGWSEKLPEGSFKSSERPTGVATRLVVIDKPDAVSGSNVAETSVKSPETTSKGAVSDERRQRVSEEIEGTAGTERVLEKRDSGAGLRNAADDQGSTRREDAGPEKQNSNRRTQGSAVSVLHSEGEDAGHYELREASDLVPSHQATQGFKKHEGYPDDVQERPYHSDENEQIKVKTNASQLDPRFVVSDNPDAVNGPPIITSDGVVLGGNSRTMSIQYAFENYSDKAGSYVDDLKRKAESFGLNSSDVDSFSQPVLVRSIDGSISRKDMARKARLYNQSRMQGLDSTAEGVSKGRMISKESMATLAQALEDYSTLRSYLDSNNSRKLIDSLLSDGVLEETQIGKLSKGTGLLNSEGKRLVELAVRGHIIDDFDTLDRLPDSTLEKLDRIVPAASKVKNRGGDWDITPILKQALQHVVKFRASKAETIETYFAQGELLGSDPSKDNPDVQSIAKAVHYAKPTAFKKMWDQYAQHVVADKKDQAALPGAEPTSPEEAKKVFEEKIHFSTSKSSPKKSIPIDEVWSAISKLETVAVNSAQTHVVQSIGDLPVHIQAAHYQRGGGIVEAAYSQGHVYFVADHIPSQKRAVELWMHEQGVHNGFRSFFNEKELNHFLNQVYYSAGRSAKFKIIADMSGLDLNDKTDRIIAAEEYLANIGERLQQDEILDGKEKSIWQKLVQKFKRWLNQFGFSQDASLTYEEIENIVKNVVTRTVRGPAKDKGERHVPSVLFAQPEDDGREYGRKVVEATEAWGKVVDSVFDKTINPRAILQMGATPQLLVELGAPDLPLTMRQDTFKKIAGLKPDKRSGHIHYLTKQQMKDLYREIADPIAVVEKGVGKFEIYVDMLEAGKPVLAILDVDAFEGNAQINSVASAYGKDRGFVGVVGAARGGTLKYMDPKRLNALEDRSGNLKPSESAYARVLKARSGNKIRFPGDVVKPVFPGDSPLFSHGNMSAKQVVDSLDDPKVRNFLNVKDIGWLQEVAALPHWIAKKFPEFQKIYERQLSRMDERSAMFSESLKEVEGFFSDISDAELNDVSQLIWKLDGKKLKEVSEPKFVPKEDDKGRPVRENGRVVLESNPEHYEQFEKWLNKKPISEKSKKAFMQVRKSLDNDFLRAYDAMREMSEIDDNEIDQFRQQINHVHNYFPHHRYGDYFVAVYEKGEDGKKECVYREHFDAATKIQANKIGRAKLRELKKKYPDALNWDMGKNEKLPDEVYGVPVDTNALEQIITSAASSIADSEQAGDIKGKLSQAVSDVLKTRGWGSHAIGRKGIPGHEKENIRRVLYDYKAGLTGWLTKMEASRDFTKAVGKINARKNPKLYKYALTYVQNMLRNSDSIDRAAGNVKALAFAWYLGGNIKTAVLNLTQNIITGVPRLGMETGMSGLRTFKAAGDCIVSAVTKGKNLKQDEQKLLDDMYKEGVITEAFLDEIRGQISGVSGSKHWNTALKWLGLPMAVAERLNRSTLALAAYQVARDGKITRAKTLDSIGLKKGEKATYEQAKQFAETIVRDAHFVYGKANQPQPIRDSSLGRGLSPIYTFRTFSHNLLSLWSWMLREQGVAGAKAFGKSLGATAVLGGVTALPFYYSLMAATQMITGDDDDWTEEIRKAMPENDLMRDVVCYGVPAMAGVSMGGSLSLEVPLAQNVQPGETPESIVGENLGELLGIPYDMFIKKPSSFYKLVKAGDNVRAVESVSPTVIKNAMAAFRLFYEGQTSVSGKPINEPGKSGPRKLSMAEAITKGMGFQPVSNTKNWDRFRARKASRNLRSSKLSGVSSRMARAIRSGDREQMVSIYTEVNSWNKAAIHDRKPWLLILPAELKRSVISRMKNSGVGKKEAYRYFDQQEAW